jgi:hypothetical protein
MEKDRKEEEKKRKGRKLRKPCGAFTGPAPKL